MEFLFECSRSSLVQGGSSSSLCPPGQESPWTGNQEQPLRPLPLKVFRSREIFPPYFRVC